MLAVDGAGERRRGVCTLGLGREEDNVVVSSLAVGEQGELRVLWRLEIDDIAATWAPELSATNPQLQPVSREVPSRSPKNLEYADFSSASSSTTSSREPVNDAAETSDVKTQRKPKKREWRIMVAIGGFGDDSPARCGWGKLGGARAARCVLRNATDTCLRGSHQPSLATE